LGLGGRKEQEAREYCIVCGAVMICTLHL